MTASTRWANPAMRLRIWLSRASSWRWVVSSSRRCWRLRWRASVSANGQTGVVEYDVTVDVTAFADGTSNNYGWILRKTNEGLTGLISFGTRESTAVARLIVTYRLSS